MFLPLKKFPDGTKFRLRVDLVEGYEEAVDQKGRTFVKIYTVNDNDPYWVEGTLTSIDNLVALFLGDAEHFEDDGPYRLVETIQQDNQPTIQFVLGDDDGGA